MKLVLFGPPGVGKGTQAAFLSEYFDIPTISTGAMIRDAIAHHTTFGQSVEASIAAGNLIPDEKIIAMLMERIAQKDCQNGYILDGFPRTIPQGEALYERNIQIDKVLFLTLEDEVIVKRLKDRRECPSCHASYHLVDHRPQKENICDRCGATLSVREDDTPESIRHRLCIYHNETEPLKEFFAKKGIVVTVKSQKELADTKRLVLEALCL